jgi:hypothetical protein
MDAARLAEELVLYWSNRVGAFSPELVGQFPILLRDWTLEELRRAIDEVALSKLRRERRGPPMSRLTARRFYETLRGWKRSRAP